MTFKLLHLVFVFADYWWWQWERRVGGVITGSPLGRLSDCHGQARNTEDTHTWLSPTNTQIQTDNYKISGGSGVAASILNYRRYSHLTFAHLKMRRRELRLISTYRILAYIYEKILQGNRNHKWQMYCIKIHPKRMFFWPGKLSAHFMWKIFMIVIV